MSGTTMVVFIVMIVFCSILARDYLRRRDEQPESDADWEAALERMDQLEERVRVLERIVTDGKSSLEREFERL